MSWVFPRDKYFEKLRYFVDVELRRHNVKIKHYHDDRGAETSADSVEARRITVNLESCGHARAERDFGKEFQTLGERYLSMLLLSGLPVGF
jgi:hypothetical protein